MHEQLRESGDGVHWANELSGRVFTRYDHGASRITHLNLKGPLMGIALPDGVKALIDDKTFPTLVTVNPDGAPQASLMWVTRDGDDLLFSTKRGRQKDKNLAHDPRVSVLMPFANPLQGYAEVRGQVIDITEEGGRELIDDLYHKYVGDGEFLWDGPDSVRLVVRVRPEKVVWIQQF